jgi:hypothetical protein
MQKFHILIVIGCLLAFCRISDAAPGTAPSVSDEQSRITNDVVSKTIEMSDSEGRLKIRLNYGGRCFLDRVQVNGREVVSAETGVCTGIQVDGNWATTRTGVGNPQVKLDGNDLTIGNIDFATGGVSVRETWRFRVAQKGIEWRIHRQYLSGGTLDDSYFPGWDFAGMTTWTAGILDTGGVAWCRYLGNGASYGAHAGSVSFWKERDCLKITTTSFKDSQLASRFSHQPSGVFTFNQSVSTKPLTTKHALHRSISGMDVWAPFQVTPGSTQTMLLLEAADADVVRHRGDFKGLDGIAITDVLDTIGRYGVVDREIVGGNGWLTGWVCLHEPFFAQMGLAIGDPNYTANLATSLDAWRDHALQSNGRVYSRWHHDTGDNMVPDTYDPATGYYECGWGYLLDSQPDYAINVAEQFDLSGDKTWLKGQKEPCERALEWLLKRDSDRDGLVEMMNDSHKDGKSSDWIDVVWASWENAFVNAKLYYALTLWAEREEILGDAVKATRYRLAASRLKESFIKPVSQGGFWNPEKGWFVYWQDKDKSIHGDNLVTAVNFAAIAYGIATPEQRRIVLDGTEARMRKENLFHWPSCFLPYAADEGAAGSKFPDYENGDVFLSWGELGVRSYAGYDPATAVAYVNRVLERYRQDGLSFQRYQRAQQTGAGDDILAGNCMTVVGLYRDIYGVRPHWNRLMLDPHLTPALSGTRLSYPLRGQIHDLTLETDSSTGSVMNFKVKAVPPFAFSASPEKVLWFAGYADKVSLEITREASVDVSIEIVEWPASAKGSRRWTEAAASVPALTHTVYGLVPTASYRLTIDGAVIATLVADAKGTVRFVQSGDGSTSRSFALEPE